jgi:glycosyltransferase involved in cell wall biosynthesis
MRGGQRQVLLLMEGLAARGTEQVLLARKDSPLFQAAQAQGFVTHPASLNVVRQMSRQADVVHAHDARAHTLAAVSSHCPVVVSRRVAFPVSQSWFSRWKYRRAALYLAVSRTVARQLEAAGIKADKICIVPDGVPCRDFQYRWSVGAPVVTLATEDPAKGSDVMSEVARRADVTIHFSTDLEQDLRDALAFVYISRSEGLGSAALLAMSMGVPVIASRIEGLAELFEHEISGVYVNNEPGEIAAAIQRIGKDPALAMQLGLAGRVRACERFSVDAMAQRTVEAYRSLR